MNKDGGLRYKAIYIIFIVVIALSYFLSYRSKNILGEEVIYIAAKDQTHSENLFTLAEVEKLEEVYPKLSISYRYETTAILKKENRSCFVRLIQTNEEYRRWNKLLLKEGSFLIDNSYNKAQLVVDEKVAFELLGKSSLTNDVILLNNNELEIKGIIKQSKLKGWYDKQRGRVGEAYIGIQKRDNELITFKDIVISGLSGRRLEDKEVIEGLLGAVKKDKKAYNIISLTQYSHQVENYMRLMRSSFAMMLLIVGWKLLEKNFCGMRERVSNGLKNYYLMEYIRQDRWYLLKEALLLTTMFIITIIVGYYFVNRLLMVLAVDKINIEIIGQLPDTVKEIKIMNRVAIGLLGLGESLIVNHLIKIGKVIGKD